MSCPTYLVPFGAQLGAGATGPVDCTAWAASRAIAAATCGERVPSGRRIRRLSDEPEPDPRSPGLNLSQVAAVAWEHFGVYLEVRTGPYLLEWEEYEERRRAGEPMVIQLSYAPIADSRFAAGRGFRGGHAIYEDRHQTIDSLADGRADGVYRYDGPLVYPRSLIREAAGELVLSSGARGRPVVRVGDGKVWCAVARDTAPDVEVEIRPRRNRTRRSFRVLDVRGGRIRGYDVRRTRGFGPVAADPPRAMRWPSNDDALRFLVRIREGRYAGQWVNRRHAREVAP